LENVLFFNVWWTPHFQRLSKSHDSAVFYFILELVIRVTKMLSKPAKYIQYNFKALTC